MPMETDEKVKEILKTMISFNVETDLEDEEARKEFVNYFSEFVGSDSDLTQAILPKLLNAMSDILVDMNIIEPEEVSTEEPATEEGGEDEDLLGDLSEPATEGLDVSKLRTCADRANDFLME